MATESELSEQHDYHIAFFSNTYLPFVGGVSRSIELYRKYLHAVGCKVQIYAPQYEGAPSDGEDVRRIMSLTDFNNSGFSIPMPLSAKPYLDMEEEFFDLVHVHHPFFLGEMGMRVARRERLPLVFTYHTQYEQYTHYVPVDKETADRTIIRHATEFCNLCELVIAPTSDIETLLRTRGVTTRIEVLPTGIELAKYPRESPEGFKQRLGLKSDDVLLLHVGRLAKEKNLGFLFEAVLDAMRDRTNVHWAIAGQGDEDDVLRKMVDNSGVDPARIHFLGMLEAAALREYYVMADLFVFSSRSETQGMVLVEAMGGATPVIALDADAVRLVVLDGQNGRLLPGDCTARDFAAAIVEAIDQPNLRKTWADNARKVAVDYDMPVLTERLRDLYKSLKLIPRHRLKQETMAFGMLGTFIETIWDKLLGSTLDD